MFRAAHCFGLRALEGIVRPSKYTSRNIFTANALGIAKLDQMRSSKAEMFMGESRQRYIERLKNYVDSNDSKSIYKDDLVNLIGIAENDRDLDLLEKILESSTEEQRTFFSGWGSATMRLYYKMQQKDRAINNIRDFDRFGGFFNMRSCYKIAMSILYDNGEYEKMLELYQLSRDRLKDTEAARAFVDRTGAEFMPDRDLTLLAFTALAKINTPDALSEAKTLLTYLTKDGKNIGLRPASLVSYLAIKNGDPAYALNLISSVPSKNYVSLRDIKILALLQSGRYEDVLLQMREYASSSKLSNSSILKTTFEELAKSKDIIQDVATRQELDDILTEIKDGNYVSAETLEGIVFRPIDHVRETIKPRDEKNGSRPPGRNLHEYETDRRPFRRNRYAENQHHQQGEDGQDIYRPRREGQGEGRRNDSRFSFQNVNFEA